jgi:hypothetical protein
VVVDQCFHDVAVHSVRSVFPEIHGTG